MNVRELKEVLEYVDDDVEVRLMEQPSWPFEYSIDRAVLLSELNGGRHHRYVEGEPPMSEDEDETCLDCGLPIDAEEHDGFQAADDAAEVLYLTEGTQLAYGTKKAWDGGW